MQSRLRSTFCTAFEEFPAPITAARREKKIRKSSFVAFASQYLRAQCTVSVRLKRPNVQRIILYSVLPRFFIIIIIIIEFQISHSTQDLLLLALGRGLDAPRPSLRLPSVPCVGVLTFDRTFFQSLFVFYIVTNSNSAGKSHSAVQLD